MTEVDRERLRAARELYMRELDEFEASYKQAIRDHFAKSEPPAPVGPAPRVESDGPITPV